MWRAARFFGTAWDFLGADLPFHFAQRHFIAAEIRLRAAGLMALRERRIEAGFVDGHAG